MNQERKKKTKLRHRLLSALLSLCMILSLLPAASLRAATHVSVPVLVACGKCGDNLEWKLENIGYYMLTINGTGDMGDYESAEDYPWKNYRSKISKVVIGDGVTSIGMYAFWKHTELTDITIPAGVVNIGDSAFAGCTKLEAITVDGQNTAYIDEDGVVFDKNKTELVCYPAGKPDWLYDIPKGVTNIGYQAFYGNTSLYRVEIPDTVTTMEGYAFGECSYLCEIEIPNSIINMEWGIFYMCSSLTSIIIPTSVTGIEYAMFYKCTNLHNVSIPANVTYIGDSAFGGCNDLKDVYYGGNEENWNDIDIEIGNGPLTNASIHYGKSKKTYNVYISEGDKIFEEEFDCSLEGCIKGLKSIDYDSKLAHMLIAMCNSVHNEKDMERTFADFGFETFLTDYSMDDIWLAYGLAKKTIENGKTTLVLVVARGTEDWKEWVSNLAPIMNNNQYKGFSDAAKDLYKKMVDFLETDDLSNMKFVITGHSRGAAASNIMSARLVDEGVDKENIFSYNFACPDTAVISRNTEKDYGCIFNISNVNDPVTWIPGSIWTESGEADGHGEDTYWSKYGKNRWYCIDGDWEDKDNYNKILSKPRNIDEVFSEAALGFVSGTVSGTVLGPVKYHLQGLYLDYLREKDGDAYKAQWKNYKDYAETTKIITEAEQKRKEAEQKRKEEDIKRRRKQREEILQKFRQDPLCSDKQGVLELGIYCPVDVEIYDSKGMLAGRIIDNAIDYVREDKVYMSVWEDEKHIYIRDNDVYGLKLIGTDMGIMTCAMRNINLDTGGVMEEQVFENVSLTDGKQMISTVNVEDDIHVSDTRLFVLDDRENAEKEVLTDGIGTEVLIEDKVTLPPMELPTDYTPIYTVNDLYKINIDPKGKYMLMNDIDLSDISGSENGWKPLKVFTGVLDGNGYRIKNMTIQGELPLDYYDDDFSGIEVGFFKYVRGTVKDLAFTDVNIDITIDEGYYANSQVGVLCGRAGDGAKGYTASIERCYATGNVKVRVKGYGAPSVGGLVGSLCDNGTIYDCYTDVRIHVIDAYTETSDGSQNGNLAFNVGGISGINWYGDDMCLNCYARGSITAVADDPDCEFAMIANGAYNVPSKNCYYLTSSGTDENGMSLTATQMKMTSAFPTFDFHNIWILDDNSPYPYPQLRSCLQVRPKSIKLSSPPLKRLYRTNERLDLTGAALDVVYEDGSEANIPVTEYMVSCDMLAGEQDVVVSYGDCMDSFEIKIEKSNPNFIVASSYTKKVGDIFYLDVDSESDGDIQFRSDNSGIATVDEDGEVRALRSGTVNILVSQKETEYYKGESKTVIITIRDRVDQDVSTEDRVDSNVSTEDRINQNISTEDHIYQTIVIPATVASDGSITETCSKCGNEKSKTVIYAADNAFLSKISYIYNGKTQKPSITVKDSRGKKLKNNTDYTVSFPKGMKSVGRYTVTVTLKGNYSGTISKTFDIVPKGTSISKVKPKKKGFTVSWKKQGTQTTGYELAYSTNHSFRSNKTTIVTVSRNKVKKIISKLKKRKRYYVRIRTYKNVMINGKNTRLYSSWSVAKEVTTKK